MDDLGFVHRFLGGDKCDACAMHTPPCITTRAVLDAVGRVALASCLRCLFLGMSITGVFLRASRGYHELCVGVMAFKEYY